MGNDDLENVDYAHVVDGGPFYGEGQRISQVACGDMHTIVLSSNWSIFTFGNNDKGQIGHEKITGIQKTPKILEELSSKKVMFVAAGKEHTACITLNDRVTYTWGNGQYGRLGHGDQRTLTKPMIVKTLVDKNNDKGRQNMIM